VASDGRRPLPRRHHVTDHRLSIQAAYDPNWYPIGDKITDTQLAAVPLRPHRWHGEWNYMITAQSELA
jgi:hypothetical protein